MKKRFIVNKDPNQMEERPPGQIHKGPWWIFKAAMQNLLGISYSHIGQLLASQVTWSVL